MKRRGSSLLMVVLLMSAISVMTITAVQVLLVTSRQGAVNDSMAIARQMVRSGVDEALNRVRVANELSNWGEYGNLAGNVITADYSLTGETRSFTGSQCATGVTFAASTNGDCPSYSLAIRSTIAVRANAGDYALFNSQAFQGQDFPSGVSIVVPVLAGAQLTLSINPSVTYSTQSCANYNGTGCGFTLIGGSPNFPISSLGGAVKSIRFKFTYVGTVSNLASIIDCTPALGQTECAIGKGYTTADITGSSGTAQVHSIIEWHGANPPVIRETSQVYTSQGIRLPY